jgi:hypothetical protein
MSMTVDQLVAEALNLPTEARAELTERLAISMDAGELTRIDRLWATESRRRLDEILQGKVETIPGDEALARARRLAEE